MELIQDYMRDETSRHMLNELTQKTFGFDFEGWVTNGYFEGDYIPYSFVEGGKMISNVSANRMKFMQNGVLKNYIQIGTAMTDPAYRGQGLAAKLMRHVIDEYENKCDGIYLFGDLSALGFYEKLNFKITNQYRYSVKEEFCSLGKAADSFKPVKDFGDDIKKRYLEFVRESAYNSSFEQVNKYGLQMFYTSSLDDVYYVRDIDCFIVLDREDGLELNSILSQDNIPLTEVLKRIEDKDAVCKLGFVPRDEDKSICECEIYDGAEDYRLFVRGSGLDLIEKDKLYFPNLSHA